MSVLKFAGDDPGKSLNAPTRGLLDVTEICCRIWVSGLVIAHFLLRYLTRVSVEGWKQKRPTGEDQNSLENMHGKRT